VKAGDSVNVIELGSAMGIDGQQAAHDALRYRIVLDTGWTLDYIDSLPVTELDRLTAYLAGSAKAQAPKGKR
jgi:hypothetical protein